MVGSPRHGNFLGILELIAQYTTFLNSISKLKPISARDTHTSTIMKELVSVMGEQVFGEIISRVKKSKCSLDSKLDAAHNEQLALVLRYLEKDGLVERFVIFMANKGHGAQEMFKALMEFLKMT